MRKTAHGALAFGLAVAWLACHGSDAALPPSGQRSALDRPGATTPPERPRVPQVHSGYAYLPYERLAMPVAVGALAIGDVTGDGREDLVVVSSAPFAAEGDVLLLRQQSDATLAAPERQGYGAAPSSRPMILLADIDEDGLRDAVIGHADGFSILRGSAGGLVPPVVVTGSETTSIAIGDVNGDSHLDVVTTQPLEPPVTIFLGDGLGAFPSRRTMALDPLEDWGTDLELADVTGDGFPDLVVYADDAFPDLWVHAHDGVDGFLPGIEYPAPSWGAAGGISVGDVNGDSLLDVVTAKEINTGGSGTAGVHFLLQLPDGTLDSVAPMYAEDLPGPQVIRDLDGDGLQDVVVLHQGSYGLGVYIAEEENWRYELFEQEDVHDVPAGSPWYDPFSLALGDLDSDGCLDAAFTHSAPDGLVVLYRGAGCEPVAVTPPSPDPPPCSHASVSGGGGHVAVIGRDGFVWAWGSNSHGQLGRGTVGGSTTEAGRVLDPSDPTGYLVGVVELAIGARHVVALKADGTVWAWGDNGRGQLGTGAFGGASGVPARVRDLVDPSGYVPNARSVGAGTEQSYAVLAGTGTIRSWGAGTRLQLGSGLTRDEALAYPVGTSYSGFVRVKGGDIHGLGLKADGTVWTWGDYRAGLGTWTAGDKPRPERVGDTDDPSDYLSGVVAIDAGVNRSVALKADGRVAQWGDWRLGTVGVQYLRAPTGMSGDFTGAVAVNTGYGHSLVAREDGTAWAWGYNHQGQLGVPGSPDTTRPIQVPGLAGVVAVDAGLANSSFALTMDGGAWAWGSSAFGQAGIASGVVETPVELAPGYPEPSAPDRRPSDSPLRVAKIAAIEVALTWDGHGLPCNVYRGTIGSLWVQRRYDHSDVGTCSDSAGTATVMAPVDQYFLVASAQCAGESSVGRDSFGVERPRASPHCP
jgi:alpha-tubulin suppressor-like RCC1 family protein